MVDTSFPAEFVDSYELGAKTNWAGGSMVLNATLFHQEYEDFQLNSFLGTSFVVRSIPEVTSTGVDLDVLWQPGVQGLMIQGGLTYADTKYGNDPLPDPDLHLLPGNQMSFAPKWSGNVSVTYEWDIGSNLMGRFNIAGYMSDYNTGSDLDPQKEQEAYTAAQRPHRFRPPGPALDGRSSGARTSPTRPTSRWASTRRSRRSGTPTSARRAPTA